MNRLQLQMHHATLSVEMGEGVDVEKTATAIETAVKAELDGQKNAYESTITSLKASLTEARTVLANRIVAAKTQLGLLKADDTDAIKKENLYLLGDEEKNDPGLSVQRLCAELERVESLKSAPTQPEQTTLNGTAKVDGQVQGNPFMPGAATVPMRTPAVRPQPQQQATS